MISNYLNLARPRSKLFCHGVLLCRRALVHDVQSSHVISCNYNAISKKVRMKHVYNYQALYYLFKRLYTKNINQQKRFISTSRRLHNEEENDPNKTPKKNKNSNSLLHTIFWLVTFYSIWEFLEAPKRRAEEQREFWYVTWNDFVHQMLSKGEVEEIIVEPSFDIVTIVLNDDAVINNKKVVRKVYQMKVSDINKFEEKLRNVEGRLGIKPSQGIPIKFVRNAERNSLITQIILISILLFWMLKSKNMKSFINFDVFNHLSRAKFTLVDPLTGSGKGVKFSDVAGLQEPKQEVMEFVDYLKRPERYQNLGAKVPKGALLLGPPGCGKTLLAKAVATEASVPFLSMNGSEFIEMIGGLGAARVRDLFKEARKRSPCIIYIDEIDAIGKHRSETTNFNVSSGENEQTLNQLLVEMDGVSSKEGVVVLASTNRSEVLDKALLRPGRFDRHILIDLPNLKERKEIFEQHLKSIRLENKPEHYSKRMASLTPGFSGADIANVCNEAALHAARNKNVEVKKANLEYAVERVVGGTEKRSSAISAAEKKIIAYHETGHALVGWLLEHTDALLKITIVPRTNLTLGFAQYIPNDQHIFSKEELFDKMCMALGGRVAESLTFNRVTTGAQNDLQKVTRMAYSQVRQYGMNENIGLLSFSGEPYSKKLHALMDEESRRLVAKAYLRTQEILNSNKDKLELIAEELLKKETLSYDDVEKLIGSPPHGNKKQIDQIEYEISVNQAAGPEPPPPEEKTRQDVKKDDHKDDEFTNIQR